MFIQKVLALSPKYKTELIRFFRISCGFAS
jgi:hypothetical protein